MAGPIQNIVFACDAGMGSSAMGASVLRNKIKAAGFPDVKVTNAAIANLTDTYDVVVTPPGPHRTGQAADEPAPLHFSVDNFMNSPRYEEIVELVQHSNSAAAQGGAPAADAEADARSATGGAATRLQHRLLRPQAVPPDILVAESVVLNGTATTRDAGDRRSRPAPAGPRRRRRRLPGRHARARGIRVHVHGQLPRHPARHQRRQGPHPEVCGLGNPLPEGIDWNGKEVKFVVGVAGINNEHLHILSSIAKVFTNKEQVAQLEAATTVEEVLDLFGKVNA